MLQGCLAALRHQVWPTAVGGAAFQIPIRTARRKHLRIAARKKHVAQKKARAVEKIEEKFVPYKIRLLQSATPKVRMDERIARWLKTPPVDDVWIARYYQPKVCTVREALSYHREVFHPSVLDAPDSLVQLDMEINMKQEKAKFLDNFRGIVQLPYMDAGKITRSVVAICKTVEDQEKALKAGADVAGHLNLITAIEKGDLKMDDVDYVLCHTDSVLETVKLRGLLKKKMPDKKKGTLGSDMEAMVNLFARGSEYASTKEMGVDLYANVKFTVGRLSLPDEHFEANLATLVNAVARHRVGDHGPFIIKTLMLVNGSPEQLRVDLSSYMPKLAPKPVKAKAGKGTAEAQPEEEKEASDEAASTA